MQAQVSPVIWIIVNKALFGLAIAGVGAFLMYPFKKARQAWTALSDSVSSVQKELTQQRENCLTTLQTQGTEQVKLLTKVAETLDGVRLDLAEQTGYLRAQSAPAPRRRAAKL